MENRKVINRYLGNRGLSTLDDAAGLMAQLGYLVEDDLHFKQLLNRCEPERRRDMYESLKPNLRFKARPLDVYMAELGREAEIQQLPVMDSDGKMRAANVTEIRTIQTTVERMLSEHHLTLTCRRCTKEEVFHGGTRYDAIHKARQAGWTYGLDRESKDPDAGWKHVEICPDCPASRS